MNGRELLSQLRQCGVAVRVDGADLVLSPASAVPTELRPLLVAGKVEIIHELSVELPPDGRLLNGGRRWIPPPDRPGWCPCDQARVWDARSGLCRTCYFTVFGKQVRVGARRGGDR